ncbi:MAG TPA: hypothetical protein V6C69_08490 [Trichormus sp.]
MFDALSPDQEQLIDRLSGLLRVDSGPDESCSADAAEAAIERIYTSIGLDAPHVVWCDGPFQLAVMPLLLQLLTFQPDETQLSKLTQKYGLQKLRAREAELLRVLQKPRWKAALELLLEQVSAEAVCQIQTSKTRKLPGAEEVYQRFNWSGCGISTADAISTLSKNYMAEAVEALAKAATLGMATALTSRLYTVPIDQSHRTKQTVNHVLERSEAIHLRDSAATVFGAARGPTTGFYARAHELHSQVEGTIFEEILQSIPAPQAAPQWRRPRNLENDATVNTAGIMAFGPYETLWGAWAGFAATCYSIISGMFRDQFSRELRTGLSDISTFLRSGFAYSPLSKVVFVCKFPRVIVDELQRLHCEDGPSIEFRDGFQIFALCGVIVPREIIEAPGSLTTKRIDEERNVELRRVLIERYGIAEYLRDTGAGIVHKSDAGTLYLKQLPGDEPIAIVQVKNSTAEADGSYKEYFLRVPPGVRTVQEAIAWTFEMQPDEYRPSTET